MPNYLKTVADLPVQERIERAKLCVEELTHRVREVLDLNAANEIIQYSGKLTEQVPKSYAARAYNAFQSAMMKQEIIRLLALWDEADENAISIPNAIALIDCEKVISALQEEHYRHHADSRYRNLNPSADPEIQAAMDEMFLAHQRKFAQSQQEMAGQVLLACVKKAKEIQDHQETTAIRNLRDHVSHSLTKTKREMKAPVAKAKYGDEKELLTKSVALIEDLYVWVNGASFDISGECTAHAKRAAEELWMNCSFQIPDQTRVE